MSKYRKLVESALKKTTTNNRRLNEGVVYPDGVRERMHPKLEEDLRKETHSLAKSPVFPQSDESLFEEKIMGERFKEVSNAYKRAFDTESIDSNKLIREMMPMVYETMEMEKDHIKKLEELAEEMVREEFNMGKDVVEIKATLKPNISLEGTKKNPKPISTNIVFEDHDEMVNANDEVYKRRFLNAMTQGAAKKTNHMYHMVDDKLTDMNPKLVNRYKKLMSAADYMYYVIPNMDNGVSGGVVRVELPTVKNPKAVIHAEAMVFPVLIHELVKGVMELLSANGLPTDKRIGDFVVDKADFLAAEPWDMRLGPALWSRFTNMIDPNDFHLKHHLYADLAALPVKEFNHKWREILANTNAGKKIVKEMMDKIKHELQEDEFNEAMNEISKKEKKSDGYDLNDLLDDGIDDIFN